MFFLKKILTYENNFTTLIVEVAKRLICHEIAELTCPQKSFFSQSVSKSCDAFQCFDGFFTFAGCIAQNHSQMRSPISPVGISTFLDLKMTLMNKTTLKNQSFPTCVNFYRKCTYDL